MSNSHHLLRNRGFQLIVATGVTGIVLLLALSQIMHPFIALGFVGVGLYTIIRQIEKEHFRPQGDGTNE